MFPWLNWAPRLHYPFSGNVARRIEPNTSWFFDSIGTHAGNGNIEKKALEVAFDRRQLGLPTEVAITLADRPMGEPWRWQHCSCGPSGHQAV